MDEYHYISYGYTLTTESNYAFSLNFGAPQTEAFGDAEALLLGTRLREAFSALYPDLRIGVNKSDATTISMDCDFNATPPQFT